MPRVESARAHRGLGAADPHKVAVQDEAGRGVQLLEPAAVQDEAPVLAERQRLQRLRDRAQIRQPPRAAQVEDARLALDLVLDPAGRGIHRRRQYSAREVAPQRTP